jgi:ADP-ribose pyrophosphatase YjhB (NUDIX family)
LTKRNANREYPSSPLVGVGVVVRMDDKILLVQRKKEPGRGLWSIPGGLVELGEKVEDAAKREVKEETGLDVEIEEVIGVFDNIIRDEEGKIRYHYILIDFIARVVGGSLKLSADELSAARWVNLEEAAQYPTTQSFRLLLRKLLSRREALKHHFSAAI